MTLRVAAALALRGRIDLPAAARGVGARFISLTASSLEEFALRASGSGAPRRSALEAVSEERAQDAATQWHLLPVAQPAQRAESEREVVAECGRLSGDPLDVTQTFTRHALRLGAWPSCFRTWFQKRYGES